MPITRNRTPCKKTAHTNFIKIKHTESDEQSRSTSKILQKDIGIIKREKKPSNKTTSVCREQ